MTLTCPLCGARAGEACMISDGSLDGIHVERIQAAAAKDRAAQNKL
jgi:hypothetical protein